MNERSRRRTERMSRSVGTLWVLALALGLMLGAALLRRSGAPVDEGEAVVVVASPEPAPRPEPVTVAGPRELFAELESEAQTLAGSAFGELRAHVPGEREAQERPLALAFHRTSVRIVGNVARTEIEETFRNDGRETLEGVYRFPLPPDAQIASLSLEVDGRWESGAFVERDHARKIWRGVIRQATPKAQRRREEFLWVPGPWEDPAILEWQAGGRFELRIFPIPGRGERRIRLAYTQTLPPHKFGRRFVIPLAASADASTRVERFEVIVETDGPAEVATDAYDMHAEGSGRGTRLSFAAADFLPTGDLIVDTKEGSESASPLRWWTFGGSASAPPPDRTREDPAILSAHRALFEDRRPYVLFALRPDLPLATETEAIDHVLVVDSSQSMVGERYTRAIGLAEAIVGSLTDGARFGVLACDLECTTLSEDLVDVDSGASARVRSWLESIRPAGASNVAEGLEHAVEFARGADRPMQIVYVGDGMASVGPRKASSLAAEVRAIVSRAPHVAISTVGIGGDADLATLAEMARAGGGVHVSFTPGRSRREVARTLIDTAGGNALVDARLELPEGVEELTPRALPTMRPGQEILLAARLDRRQVRGEVRLRGEIAGQPYAATFPVEITATDARGNAFVAREWARRAIDALEVGGDGEDVPKIVALSKAYGVLSRHTSLLVLESEAMFRAFGVDRREPSLEWTGEEAVEGGAAADLAMSVHEAPGTRGASAGLGTGASAPAEMERREAPASARKKAASSDEAFAHAPSPPSDDALVALPAAPVRRPPGRMMREVAYREGIIARSANVPAKDLRALQSAESALRENPDSRDRHRALVRALSRVGDVEGARQVAERWLERDPLDPEALTYLADALGRMGDQKNALRTLSGVVDLAPNGDVLHQRLANAFERGGMPERACGHHVARAEADPTQAESVGAAIRCERARGRIEAAERLLASMPSPILRDKAENAARSASLPSSRGELILDASWSRGVDLDVSIITPEGTRLSWMGGRVHVVGEHGRTPGRERLGLRRAAVGSYLVEIARTDPNDRSPIAGRIDVQVLGQTQTLPFSLDGARALAGRVDVVRRTRLEPVW